MTRKDDGEINNSWETWDSHGIPNNWVLVPHFRFEQKSTAGSRGKLSTENHRSHDLGYLHYVSFPSYKHFMIFATFKLNIIEFRWNVVGASEGRLFCPVLKEAYCILRNETKRNETNKPELK